MQKHFMPINIALLTVSDTRTMDNDTSGNVLQERILQANHCLSARQIVSDNIYQIRSVVSSWIVDSDIQVVITCGGTGLTGHDGTPEAISVLLDKEIAGFGELFRHLSYQSIRTSTVQSRTLAGVTNSTFIFCLPGSINACKTAWDGILKNQLDIRHRPCNFAELIPRLAEK